MGWCLELRGLQPIMTSVVRPQQDLQAEIAGITDISILDIEPYSAATFILILSHMFRQASHMRRIIRSHNNAWG